MGIAISLQEDWAANTSEQKLAAITVCVASVLSVALGVLNYPVIGHDAYVHLNWLDQFTTLRAHGIAYPRWLPDSFGGFGSPTFYFYPPLVYFLASFIHDLLALRPEGLYHVVQLFAASASVVTAYAMLMHYQRNRILLFTGSLLYAFIGYRLCDVYIRNALTEHFALVFLPLLFIRYSTRTKRLAVWSLVWAALLCTNLPVAYMGGVALFLYCAIARRWTELIYHGISVGIAIAISAFYLFPALEFRSYIHSDHLSDLDLNTSHFGFAISDLFTGHIDWLRILSVLTLLVGVLFLFLTRRGGLSKGWIGIGIAAIVLQIPFVSVPIWKILPGLQFVQFSWRWCGLLMLFIALVSVRETKSYVAYGIAALALVSILCELTISRNLFHRPPYATNDYRMDAPEYMPRWSANDPHEVIGLTLRRQKEPEAVPLGLIDVGDSISLDTNGNDHSPYDLRFLYHLTNATPARFHMLYWPLWKGVIDGRAITTLPDANGYLTATIPAGSGYFSLVLADPDSAARNLALSLTGAAILLSLLAASTIQTFRKT